jgi:putative polyketide hydroxylase
MTTTETPILIIGAGPAGLSVSLTLSGLGVGHLLVDRHPAAFQHPKAVGIMQRTAELFRAWGVEDELRARGVPQEFYEQSLWMTTLAGEELGRTPTPDPDAGRADPPSPTSSLRCPQHVTEEVLRARAAEHGCARLQYGFHVSSLEQDDAGVTATLLERASGEESTVRAGWVIAADGNDSGVRHSLGIGREGQADMGHFINVFFRAPLGPMVADRPAWSYAVLTPELTGAFVTLDGADEWILHRNLSSGETFEQFPAERCVEVVRQAAGVNDLDVQILSVGQWIMGAELSTRFRSGRILLTGDAAHRTTPDGGVGMNTAIASAHNVAWKVGAVAAGWAHDSLLDTYEPERRAVAQRNVDYSAGRGSGMGKMMAAVRAGDMETVKAGIAMRGAMAGRQGMDLGYTYTSAAIIPDGTDLPAVENPARDYVQTARPGSRAPHMWLAPTRSTLDLFGSGLVLLTGAEGGAWERAATAEAGSAPLQSHVVRTEGNRFEQLYEIGSAGAVLVRPDGFVAWRTRSAPKGDGTLRAAVTAVVGAAAPAATA